MKIRNIMVCLGLILVLMAGMLTACTKPAPAPAPAPTPTPAPAPAPKPAPQKLMHGTIDPDNYPQSLMDKWYYREVEKRSGGLIQIEDTYGASLVTGQEGLRLVSTGAVPIVNMPPAYNPAELPLLGLPNNVKGIPSGAALANALLEIQLENGPLQKAWEAEAARNNFKLVIWEPMEYQYLTVKPISTLAELKGLKIRSFGIYEPEVLKRFGAIPVSMMAVEWYESLARGTIDGIPATVGGILPYKLYEVAKYASFHGGAICALPVEINLDVWNSFSPEIQNAFAEPAFLKESCAKFNEIWKECYDRDKKVWDTTLEWVKVDPAEQEALYDMYIRVAIETVPVETGKKGYEKEGIMSLDQIYSKATGHDLAWWKAKLGIA